VEFVQGELGNLRLINVSIDDAGQYSCEAYYPARLPAVVYMLKVRAPIEVRVTPHERVCDYGTRVELECIVSGYPHQVIYWLHNAERLKISANTLGSSGSSTSLSNNHYSIQRRESSGVQSIRERLIINSFSLEDAGVYQCVAESSLADDPTAKSSRGSIGAFTASSPSSASTPIVAKVAEKMGTGIVSIGDLVDNAQDTAHLVMGKMKPMRTFQSPAPAESFTSTISTSQILLSKVRGELNTTIECRFAANPLPTIRWFRDDLPLNHDGEIADDKGVVVTEIVKDPQRPYSLITRLKIDLNHVPPWDELWQYGGEYRGVANNSLGSADCRTFLLLDTPLRLRPVDSSKPAIAGRFHDLKCYFIGSGIPKLQWHRIKNGQRIERIPVDHRHVLLENARVLRIKEVNKEEDEADYRCTAMLGDMTDNIAITLKVSRAPRIQDLPEVQRVQGGGQSLTYSCATQNHADKPWYAWWRFQLEGSDQAIDLPPDVRPNPGAFKVSYAADLHQSERLPMSESLRRQLPSFVHARPNSVVHVQIEQLNKRQHQGILTCKIVNEVGYDERPIRVTFIPELEFEIRPPNKQDVTLAQNISINCTARPSELAPMIVWKYSDESTGDFKELDSLTERTDGRIYQESNGTLTISQVEESDPRKFLCFLTPKESTTAVPISVAVNLEIHVPARIEPLKDADAVRGSKFNLTCVVQGDANELQANWYHRPISNADGSEAPWRLINQTCVLPSSYGEADNTALAIASSAYPESDPLACQKSATGRFDSGVIFRQVSSLKQSGRGIERQLQFDSLKDVHMAEYMCNASNFYNRDKEGRRTDVRQIIRLTVISIPDPVTFVQNSSQTTATSVSFSWSPPAHNGNKEILRYWIRYYQADSAASESNSAQAKSSNLIEFRPHERQATLTGLRPYTKYNIAIKAENEVGFSLENSLVLTTQEAKPEGPVQQLNASGTASDTIYVAWQKPKLELRNGNVDRYSVCHQRVNESRLVGSSQADLARLPWPRQDLPVTEDSSITSGSSQVFCSLHRQQDTEITGLPKFTAYAIRVIAINSKGQSPPAYVLARTLEDLPQAPPTNVTCSSQQYSIAVAWDPPNFETVNGILTEYLVNYYKANDYGDETNSVIQVVQGQTTVTLAGLLANTRYVIQVAASNRKGRGPLSPKKTCVTTEAPPEAPENVKAFPVNGSCVMVSWSHPSRPQGLTRRYCIAIYRQDNLYRSSGIPMSSGSMIGPGSVAGAIASRCENPDFSKPYNYYLFCGLSTEYLYNISVMAKNRFDGRKAYVSSVALTSHPTLSIISIGGTIVAQEGMRVLMDCLVVGYPSVDWTFDIVDDVQQLDNGTLIIESVEPRHSGKYICRHREDSISYELKVQAVSNDPPKPPVVHKVTPSLRNIQVEWLSPGSRRIDAPITWFHLDWTNEYTGLKDSIRLPADRRTYYLSNLTCATTVRFQIRAENQFGFSAPTEPISAKTEGSAPLFIGETDMVPAEFRLQNSITFNFSVFGPGNNCSPIVYRFRIWPAADGSESNPTSLQSLSPASSSSMLIGASSDALLSSNDKGSSSGASVIPLHYNLTLTKRDLFSFDGKPWNRRCCYNLSGLNPGSYYQYHVVAENPAGKTPHFGFFWTRTVGGIQPREGASTRFGRTSFLAQPTIMVPLIFLFVVLFVAIIALFFYCRHRKLEAELNPSATNKSVVGRPIPAIDHPQSSSHIQQIQHSGAYGGGGRHRGTLPPIPVNESTEKGSEYREKGGFLGRWNRNTGLYDRGRAGTIVSPSVQLPTATEPDRLSTSSMDSAGNLSPYATYAAGGILEEEVNQPVPSKSSTALQPSSRTLTTGRNLDASAGTSAATGGATRMYKTCNKGYRSERQQSYMHQYHYPDLGNPEMEGLLETTRRGGNGAATGGGRVQGRFLPISDPRTSLTSRQFQHHALLDPPLHQPYVNNESGIIDDEDDIDFFGPRRINSFESLRQHVFRQGGFPTATTYHRGYARARGANGVENVPNAGPPGTAVGGPSSGVFYDTRNPHLALDPLTAAYRGSVLSSTTVSSNQDELMQAYEYGRKHGRLLATGNTVTIPTSRPGDIPVSTVVNSGNGGSGSSETTDPGICQFTQQPPLPDELEGSGRLPAAAPNDISRRGGGRQGLTAMAIASDALPPAFLKRQLSECPSEMTDAYSSVDYSAIGANQTRAIVPAVRTGPISKLPTIPQNQQLMAARNEYPDLESDSGMSGMARGTNAVPGYHRQSSQHSYYYPTLGAVTAAGSSMSSAGDTSYYGHSTGMARQQKLQRGVRRQESMPSGVVTSASRPRQPRHYQQARNVSTRSVSTNNGTSTGYSSGPRGGSVSDGRPQQTPTTKVSSTVPAAAIGHVESTEDEENIYTSEFVLV
ncbi:unnamed protein product, partial [Hymenolepis diminuta]